MDEGLIRWNYGLRALLVVLPGHNFAFCLEPVFVFKAGSASPFLVELIGALPDLGFKIDILCVRR